jgi:diguanylate cyclase (GGDEF)-like protein
MPELPRSNSPQPDKPHPSETFEGLQERVRLLESGSPDDPEFGRRVAYFAKQSRIIREAQISPEHRDRMEAVLKADMERRVEFDPLTGLYRKEAFLRRLDETFAQAYRTGKPVSIAFIDLDNFGMVNKELSHLHGDAALQQVGGFLRSIVKRESDIIGKYGGEEIVVVLPDTNEDSSRKMLEEIREQMPIIVGQALTEMELDPPFNKPVTASIGIAQAQGLERPLATLRKANDRMNIAKKLGRNTVVGTQEEQLFNQTEPQ